MTSQNIIIFKGIDCSYKVLKDSSSYYFIPVFFHCSYYRKKRHHHSASIFFSFLVLFFGQHHIFFCHGVSKTGVFYAIIDPKNDPFWTSFFDSAAKSNIRTAGSKVIYDIFTDSRLWRQIRLRNWRENILPNWPQKLLHLLVSYQCDV